MKSLDKEIALILWINTQNSILLVKYNFSEMEVVEISINSNLLPPDYDFLLVTEDEKVLALTYE